MYKRFTKIIVAAAMLLMANSVSSQTVTLRFTGASADNSYVRLDSVQVCNVSRSWTEALAYPDTVFEVSPIGIVVAQSEAVALQSYPNPFRGTASVIVSVTEGCDATLCLHNIAGQTIATSKRHLQSGGNLFGVSLKKAQVALLTVSTPQGQSTIKLIGCGGTDNAIVFHGMTSGTEKRQSSQTCHNTDTMLYIGYATINGEVASAFAKRNRLASEDVVLTFVPGVLNGLFSVSDSTWVRFSQGNLQWSATGGGTAPTTHTVAGGGTAYGTWRFAPNQWNCIDSGNNNADSTYTGWIDLFGWGTSGWNNGNYFYQPFNTSDNNVSGLGPLDFTNGYGYGPTDGSSYTYSLLGAYANADWGVYNAISNGGNAPGFWRTLTSEEWVYLLNTRNGGIVDGQPDCRYTLAMINTDSTAVSGLILIPDNFNGVSNANVTWGTINNPTQWSTTCTYAGWQELEAAGCVFLPAAGNRHWIYTYNDPPEGCYWSSTQSSSCNAYLFYFRAIMLNPQSNNFRCYGSSVRLVQDVR